MSIESKVIKHLQKLDFADLERVATMVADLDRNITDEEYSEKLASIYGDFEKLKTDLL